MSLSKPRFTIGDVVREKFPYASANRSLGIIKQSYLSEGEYRYVVKFDSGNEEVFFEKELIADRSKAAHSRGFGADPGIA